jgi:lysophospholipase L1-like esterase
MTVGCSVPAPSSAAAGESSAPVSVAPTLTAPPSATQSRPAWTYAAFGDSWPYGAHCNGCRPFPGLYAEGLATATGRRIEFVNRTTNGGTAQQLLATMKVSEPIRTVIGRADILVIAIGGNDLEPAFEASAAGSCGGADQLDCFRDITETLRATFDGMLAEIETLRDGRPTAIRLVTMANEFLTDEGLIDVLGAEFGKTSGVTITRMLRDMQCEVAAAQHAVCVDLGLALNGPDLLVPMDVQTQAGMQAVADAILATGLDELE